LNIIEITINQKRRIVMSDNPDAFVYQAELDRVVDGDTVDVILDLGFDVKLHKQRVRLAGIDTPESRTRDLAEKKLGLAAKERLKELCVGTFKIKSLGKGKYGRILGIPYTEDGQDICQMLIKEGHAVVYDGGKKNKVWGDY
jgi:micrococcal nuclease